MIFVCHYYCILATKYDAKKDKESKRKKKKEELLAIEQAHQRALEEKGKGVVYMLDLQHLVWFFIIPAIPGEIE